MSCFATHFSITLDRKLKFEIGLKFLILDFQLRKSTIHGHPVTLRMLRVKSDKSDWFWSQSIVFTQPARGPDISSA